MNLLYFKRICLSIINDSFLYIFSSRILHTGLPRTRTATFFNAKRAQLAKHQMETVGAELRKNMLWGDDTDPDTASN